MSSGYDLNFMEDNFLSDDDWASPQINFGLELNESSKDSKHFTDWSADNSLQNSTYLQHENETKCDEFHINELLVGVGSPPLTPEDTLNVDEFLIEASNSTTISPCDELLSDICVTEPSVASTVVPPQLSLVRNRSNSDESSSTSAYSSQSPTPPPKPQNNDVHENLFFNDSHPPTQELQIPDEGFHETISRINTHSKILLPNNSVQNNRFKPKKTTSKRNSPIIVSDEESDFDRRYAEALKETHRLLGTNKTDLSPTSNSIPQTQPNKSSKAVTEASVDLRQLCDSTILQPLTTTSPRSTTRKTTRTNSKSSSKTLTSDELLLKELKRKASENLKNQGSNNPVPTSLHISNLNRSNPAHFSPQSCRIPITHSNQISITGNVVTSEPPIKIFVKQETAPKLYLATTSNSNTVTFLPATNSPSSNISKEIPLRSLVLKPENRNTSVPVSSLNFTNCPTPATTNSISIHNIPSNGISHLNNYSLKQSNNESKPIDPQSTSRPLMVSQPAKKSIVPNGNVVYPSSLLQSCLSVPSPNNNRIQTDYVPLNNLDMETQNRVLKRQQRMIKNRQWACLSRQRRKEYIAMLEQRIGVCLEENHKLKEMNSQLRNRVYELENENSSLRSLSNTSSAGHRKAACILMLVLFIGFNINPLSFSPGKISSDTGEISLKNSSENWPVPAETGFHGRQLLALVDKEVNEDKRKQSATKRNESTRNKLYSKWQSKQEYWLDDIVKSYKKEHITKILEILQVTSPISLQRLLRRKLKEELGFTVPMLTPKARRISYTPASDEIRHNPSSRDLREPLLNLESPLSKGKIPLPPPKVSNRDHMEEPCIRLSKSFDQPNETESIRVNDDLAKWIKQHEVQQRRQTKSQHTAKSRDQNKRVEKLKRRRRHSNPSYSSFHTKSSVPVLYEKRDEKLKRLLKSIQRKNDTLYMISFSKDHILLPASALDASGHTKMSLVLPTTPPNDSFVGSDQDTMIQINCEVHSTNYVKVDKKLLAGVGYTDRSNQNPKRKAFHGSKTKRIEHSRFRSNKEQDGGYDDEATVTEIVDL